MKRTYLVVVTLLPFITLVEVDEDLKFAPPIPPKPPDENEKLKKIEQTIRTMTVNISLQRARE